MISGIWTKKTSRPPDFGTGVIYTFSDVVAPKTQDICEFVSLCGKISSYLSKLQVKVIDYFEMGDTNLFLAGGGLNIRKSMKKMLLYFSFNYGGIALPVTCYQFSNDS